MTSQSEGKSTAAMPPIKRRYLPSLGAFATFEVAAKHLSFTLAAKELNVTQGAVSRAVKGLEDHLGVTLFQRLPRALALTDEGKVLLKHLGFPFKAKDDPKKARAKRGPAYYAKKKKKK